MPCIGYSHEFNKTLYDFKTNKISIYHETYNPSMDKGYIKTLISKYLRKEFSIIDLSTDTWFNYYIVRIMHSIGSFFSGAFPKETNK